MLAPIRNRNRPRSAIVLCEIINSPPNATMRTRRVRTGMNQSWTTQKSCARTVLNAGRVASILSKRVQVYSCLLIVSGCFCYRVLWTRNVIATFGWLALAEARVSEK